MREGIIFGLRTLGKYIVLFLLSLMFLGMIPPTQLWLQALLNAVFLAGFALFRILDIAKPFGIRALQELPGGWGVVADDLAAALGTCALLHIGIGFYAVM